MELGYVQAPHKTMPVVFDSPRNGELQGFPYKRILVSGGANAALGTKTTQPQGHPGIQGVVPGTLFCRSNSWLVTV